MTPPEEISASQRMHEIIERRDEIRRQSEERVKQGLAPFPTVEEVRQRQQVERELRVQEETVKARLNARLRAQTLEELEELG